VIFIDAKNETDREGNLGLYGVGRLSPMRVQKRREVIMLYGLRLKGSAGIPGGWG